MTREEAIEILNKYDLNFCDIDGNPIPPQDVAEACDMAIEALDQEETLQNLTEPNKSDLISRQAILNLAKEGKLLSGNIYKKASDYINELPSAERHSAWVYCEDKAGHDGFRCEKCDTFYPWYYEYYHSAEDFISDYNFCPNCGARMESDTE